jgi:hypothetical protein
VCPRIPGAHDRRDASRCRGLIGTDRERADTRVDMRVKIHESGKDEFARGIDYGRARIGRIVRAWRRDEVREIRRDRRYPPVTNSDIKDLVDIPSGVDDSTAPHDQI